MTTDDQGEDAVLRKKCWDKSADGFGTAAIFLRRSRRLVLKLRILTYVGLLAPIVVGLTALALGASDQILPTVITVAAWVGLIQVVIFLWSVVAGWVESNSYALASAAANNALSIKYRELAEAPPDSAVELKHKIELLDVEDNLRRQHDDQQSISDSELRRGMRASLRQYRQECTGCGEVPRSMVPTACEVCGAFGTHRLTSKLKWGNRSDGR